MFDPDLEALIRATLWVGAQDDLTCGLVSGLTILDASSAAITRWHVPRIDTKSDEP